MGEPIVKCVALITFPICSDTQNDEPTGAPIPPPRPDLVDDTVRDDVPHSTVPSSVTTLKREAKSGTHGSSKQSSLESTTSLPKSPIHTNVSTPIQVSVDETSDAPVYVNLDEVNVRPNSSDKVTANPPPLPPRQGSPSTTR